ncbi:putative pyrroloquinoline-quinone binding quinoprotein [Nocardioides aurantiacus]|uniref:Putative pyrroloquinoline-quinone binding quinoprotein n=1 Tax=Nocardioides aurantiacus TaxID=86796 RepID=A0A3N2CNZ0_9ACTN|nr:putative pyrroloquinoline-quinone binding quinoprotein [Nocardioides aurantiacus]
MVALVVAVLAAGAGTWLTRREAAPGCGAEVTSYAAADSASPFLDADARAADPDERRDRLVEVLQDDGGPLGEVLGAVGYDYQQWAQVGGYAQGIGVRTRDDPDFTMLDDETLEPRWSVAVGTQRSTYDADHSRYVVLTLPADRAPDVVALDADSGRQRWCARLDGGPLSRESVVSTQLLDEGIVVLADDRLSRLGPDGPGWERDATLTGTDFLGSFDGGLLVGGSPLTDLLDPSALERREAGPALALLDADTGRARWTDDLPAGAGVSVVGTTEDRAVLTRWDAGDAEGRLVALDADGREAWSVVPARGTAYDATVRAGRVLVRAGTRWSAYDATDGRRLWAFTVPATPQFLPYGSELAAVPLLDEDHVLVAGTDALHVLDLRTGRRTSTPLPTDGVSTTFWPYAVVLSPSLVALATNTAAVVARRADLADAS